MADAETPAVDIGEAIQRGVALLAQQSVATPTFKMAAVAGLYREGVRCFELVKWYSQIEAQPATDRRVSYACSSFGVSIPGAVACKSHTT